MLKMYKNRNSEVGEKYEGKKRLRCSPSDRRGRRRTRGRVGHGIVAATLLPGDRSNVSNLETESAAARIRVVNRSRNNNIIANNNIGVTLVARVLGIYVVRSYFGIFYKLASCVMGMFKWLRKDFVQWDRNRRNLPSPERRGLNKNERKKSLTMVFERRLRQQLLNSDCQRLLRSVMRGEISGAVSVPRIVENRVNSEAYRSALQAFLDRRRDPGEGSEASQSPKLSPTHNRSQDDEILYKNPVNDRNKDKDNDENQLIPGVPHIEASELFEVGWVAGTEDRYLELISAEWQHTRTALRRSSHPDCFNAVRADLEVLTEIRHPHTLLLMGTTRTDEHGTVAIFESVDCTLYNYVHEQGERVSVQGAARCAGQLADALRHAHARGIVHGAVSSHCVFLAASGTAKLGGWELAVRENEPRPYREWEERLRSEIFRWQAPEMFYGDAPSKACDVYALALLIWEMCTGRAPWSGLNEAEIERQYVHWERGVPTDTYNFPPLLCNLLEAGLQIDVGKRKLDMNRTHRFLRRLELQYEEESPIYVDRHSNNNNSQIKTFNAPVSTSPLIKSPSVTPKRESNEIGNSLMGKKLFSSDKMLGDNCGENNSTNDIHSKKYETAFINNENREGSATDFRAKKNTNFYLDSRKNPKVKNEGGVTPGRNNKCRDKPVSPDGRRQRIPNNGVEDKVKKSKNLVAHESSVSEPSTVHGTPNSSGDESCNDTKTDIKKLKEILATKRSNFFYGNSSPTNLEASEVPDVTQPSPPLRERILREARGKSCEPCKPASHKINLELQVCKSPTEYNPTLIKPASHQNQRIPQSHVSPELRQAVTQSHTLNSSASSFFETSLWRKEKLICLAKMRKDNPEYNPEYSIVDKKTTSKTSGSPKSDAGHTVSNDASGERSFHSQKAEESNVFHRHSSPTSETELTENGTLPITPLQALKEALDRVTDIIRSVTPNIEESGKLSPDKSLNDSDIVLDDTGVKESIFESLNRSKLGGNNADDEIKSIERSLIEDRDSLLTIGITREKKSDDKLRPEEKEKSKCVSFSQTSHDADKPCNDNCATTRWNDSLIQRLQDFTSSELFNGYTDDANDSLNHLAERSLMSSAMIFLNNKSQEKDCKACQHRNLLARRRSLPAGLGQFRSIGNVSPLGRLPIRRGEMPDATVEDLYIDDEFGDNLNINMVLLEDEDEVDNQDLLSSLLGSPNT